MDPHGRCASQLRLHRGIRPKRRIRTPRCCLADFILGPGGQKVLEEYEYGNPTKDYGFKRWYPEQGMSAEQIDKLEEQMAHDHARSDQDDLRSNVSSPD